MFGAQHHAQALVNFFTLAQERQGSTYSWFYYTRTLFIARCKPAFRHRSLDISPRPSLGQIAKQLWAIFLAGVYHKCAAFCSQFCYTLTTWRHTYSPPAAPHIAWHQVKENMDTTSMSTLTGADLIFFCWVQPPNHNYKVYKNKTTYTKWYIFCYSVLPQGTALTRVGSLAYRATQFFENISKKTTPRKKTRHVSTPGLSLSGGDLSEIPLTLAESSISSSNSIGNLPKEFTSPTSDSSQLSVFGDSVSGSSLPPTPDYLEAPIVRPWDLEGGDEHPGVTCRGKSFLTNVFHVLFLA